MSDGTARIEDYALIGDLHTAALVGRDGSIDWLCLPHFDSPACFAALLHDDSAGRWQIAPEGSGAASSRQYVDHTLILETTWETETGAVRLVDFMPPRGEAADVVRIVEGVRGSVDVEMTLRLRFDYGRVKPWVREDRGGLEAVAGPDAAWLAATVDVRDDGDDLRAAFTVEAGQRETFVLTHCASHLPTPEPVDPAQAHDDTVAYWTEWTSRSCYEGPWAQEVERSLILLKALTYAPTGGIVAAATTSLPEDLGGSRNWDYRFCWLRDATFALRALVGTGYTDEARAWREWLVRAVAGDPQDLQIMYGLDGRRRIPETELSWLSGFGGSAPVRVGNDAVGQFQLDVWGEVLNGLYLSREAGLQMVDSAWDLQVALVEWIAENWRRKDNGLWEVRGPQRHFVHSKVMAWVGMDCGVRTVEEHGLPGPIDHWREVRDQIHADVCEHGFDADRGTFTQFYGSQGLDAALLLLPRVGFLPFDDPRILGTIEAVQAELTRDGFLLRYDPRADGGTDGLPGTEGAFLACSFWLVSALQGIGRWDEAGQLFERLLQVRNDVGMLSEEYDPRRGQQLGNTPQAFSLVGLVNNAGRFGSDAPQAWGAAGDHREEATRRD